MLSLVRSNHRGVIGFLSDDRRLNVAITRARRHVAVVCDSDTVSGSPLLARLVKYVNTHGVVLSAINGYDAIVSNQLANNDVLFGDFSQLIFATWSGLDLTVDPWFGASKGNVRVIALQDCDFGIKQPGAFCYGT